MKSPSRAIVHGALGLHLGIDPHTIDDTQRLAEDLGLDRLDLVMVALRFEALGLTSEEFPVAMLESIETVGDLVVLFRAFVGRDTLDDIDCDRDTDVGAAIS